MCVHIRELSIFNGLIQRGSLLSLSNTFNSTDVQSFVRDLSVYIVVVIAVVAVAFDGTVSVRCVLQYIRVQ